MVNLSIPKDVVTKARELGINMSEAATRALRKEIRQRMQEDWRPCSSVTVK